MRLHALTLLATLLMPVAALATTGAMNLTDILSQQRQIREEVVAPKGSYSDMPGSKRDELLRRQDALFQLFEGKKTASELNEVERAQAVSTLEWIETAIRADNDEDRKICRAERTLGSNRITRICRTAGQMADERERAREALQRSQSGKF